MNRIPITPRADWRAKVESLGFNFHSVGEKYWDESVFYEFSMAEITAIERPRLSYGTCVYKPFNML